ncbi:hypothetical protein BJX65DRAFT_305132 [Aspergillus insuetus]
MKHGESKCWCVTGIEIRSKAVAAVGLRPPPQTSTKSIISAPSSHSPQPHTESLGSSDGESTAIPPSPTGIPAITSSTTNVPAIGITTIVESGITTTSPILIGLGGSPVTTTTTTTSSSVTAALVTSSVSSMSSEIAELIPALSSWEAEPTPLREDTLSHSRDVETQIENLVSYLGGSGSTPDTAGCGAKKKRRDLFDPITDFIDTALDALACVDNTIDDIKSNIEDSNISGVRTLVDNLIPQLQGLPVSTSGPSNDDPPNDSDPDDDSTSTSTTETKTETSTTETTTSTMSSCSEILEGSTTTTTTCTPSKTVTKTGCDVTSTTTTVTEEPTCPFITTYSGPTTTRPIATSPRPVSTDASTTTTTTTDTSSSTTSTSLQATTTKPTMPIMPLPKPTTLETTTKLTTRTTGTTTAAQTSTKNPAGPPTILLSDTLTKDTMIPMIPFQTNTKDPAIPAGPTGEPAADIGRQQCFDAFEHDDIDIKDDVVPFSENCENPGVVAQDQTLGPDDFPVFLHGSGATPVNGADPDRFWAKAGPGAVL